MSRLKPVHYVLIGLALVLLLILGFSMARQGDSDRLSDDQIDENQASAEEDAQERCGSQRTYDLIKRDLFRQAAQLRGSDQAAFDQLSAQAVVRMDNPVYEGTDNETGAVRCSGSLSLALPPGLAVVGGRTTLSADVDYTLQSAADGSGTVVTIANADRIVSPLATLGRVRQPAEPTLGAGASASNEVAPGGSAVPSTGQPVETEPAAPPAPIAPEPPATSAARPSFNCANARTRGEIAVCRDPGLASLDRQMAAQFGAALSDAGPEQRALLQRTRSAFLRYRDNCPNDACIAETYRGRMREIRDIMAGRWRPQR